MIANIRCGLSDIARLPTDEIAGCRGRFLGVEHRLGELSKLCTDEKFKAQLDSIRVEINKVNATFDLVSRALDTEFLDAAGGLEAFVFLLNGLDSDPIPASSLYCLLKPLSLRLDKAHSIFNDWVR